LKIAAVEKNIAYSRLAAYRRLFAMVNTNRSYFITGPGPAIAILTVSAVSSAVARA